jgi:uncharacterized membrane protein
MQKNLSNAAIAHGSRNIWSGVLFGIGLVAFLDEALFH